MGAVYAQKPMKKDAHQKRQAHFGGPFMHYTILLNTFVLVPQHPHLLETECILAKLWAPKQGSRFLT